MPGVRGEIGDRPRLVLGIGDACVPAQLNVICPRLHRLHDYTITRLHPDYTRLHGLIKVIGPITGAADQARVLGREGRKSDELPDRR